MGILSIGLNLFTQFSNLINHDTIFIAITLVLYFIAERRMPKIKKTMLALVIGMILFVVLKFYFHIPRVCTGMPNCPSGFGFPSGHSTAVDVIAISFLKVGVFPLYLLYAILVMYSRVFIGAHTFYQVAASLPVAALSYHLADRILKKEKYVKKKLKAKSETLRQVSHILASFVFVGLLLLLGKHTFSILFFGGIVLGAILVNLRVIAKRFSFSKILDLIENVLERPGVRIPAFGTAMYLLGFLFAIVSPLPTYYVISVLLILGVGDGMATIIGSRYGKHKIFYGKSLEGFLAFVVSASILTFPLIGWIGILGSVVGGILELISVSLDDNITIPIALTMLFYLFV